MFIIYTNNSSEVGWIIVALIFEGAGVIPLLITLVGFIRLMLVQPIYETKHALTWRPSVTHSISQRVRSFEDLFSSFVLSFLSALPF
jgi:hypothetical protein